jgi:two-component system, NtrC family, nitrogen regulation response regulator GlnG
MRRRFLCLGPDRSWFARALPPIDTSLFDCAFAEYGSRIKLQPLDVIAVHLPANQIVNRELLAAVREHDSALMLIHDPNDLLGALGSAEWVKSEPRVIVTADLEAFAQAASRIFAGSAPQEPWREFLIGEHACIQNVFETIRLVARRNVTVLITGETGTGKELVARAIHLASGRSNLPLVGVNCAALPENLLEAELFGHTKGAFTGASSQRVGRFEQANHSTIFLDEIGDLPLEVQAKLLRALQEREIQRLGSSESVQLDIRVIAATNSDLLEAVRQKKFRQDLFYRLNVVPMHVPPLRERISDIPILVDYFLDKICRHERLPMKMVVPEAVDHLSSYSWPGNVRELEHQVEKAVVLSGDRRQLCPADFALSPATAPVQDLGLDMQLMESGLDFSNLMVRIERALLDQALKKAHGNKARAAGMLGMKRTTLLSKVKALGPCT